jgi:pyruvate,orthophosphate dikinase
MNQRAITYRRLHNIPESWDTAVNVQAMVFGNMGETSATGVAFTRNPSTGEKSLYGEFLLNAQGEDVVAGIRTPQEITEKARAAAGSDKPSMEKSLPDAFKELIRIYGVLEKHYRDMQDLEFTVEQGKLWMLQTRSGKRTAKAALRIAVELANEKLISKDEAVTLTPPIQLTLESAIEFIEDDELVEVTPKSIRLRKRFLSEHDRKRAARDEKAA